jgi:predicted acyltransferase
MPEPSPAAPRLVSLDQFRGYTVLGMFLVNFVGSYAAVRAVAPVLGHHHTYCSYADTIMPQFFCAIGFAYRLTFLRRAAAGGGAYRHAIRRNLALLLVAFVVHSVGGSWGSWGDSGQRDAVFLRWAKQDLFQTLTHIAVTSLWVLPVIAARPGVRVGFAAGSGLLHLGLSYAFNYRWANTPPNGVDGGPLGFLTWTVPLIAGSLAYDAWAAAPAPGRLARRLFGWGLVVMVGAYGLSCLHLAPADLDDWGFRVKVAAAPPPLVHVPDKPPTNDLFTMSQRSGSLTYLGFGAGFSLAVFALFVWACDGRGLRAGVFRMLGTNALAGYIVHGLAAEAIKPLVPRDAPLWYVGTGFAAFLAVCLLLMRGLERQRLFLRL